MTSLADWTMSGERLQRSIETAGSQASALSGTMRSGKDARWQNLTDTLLKWMSQGGDLFDSADRPSLYVLQISLELVKTLECMPGYQVPASVTPSGGGAVCFEWADHKERLSIELFRNGSAEVTKFGAGAVEDWNLSFIELLEHV